MSTYANSPDYISSHRFPIEDDDEPMTDTAPTTFEPDWDKLWFARLDVVNESDDYAAQMEAVITEYQRQMAEAGYVVVRRELVEENLKYTPRTERSLAAARRLREALDR
jgi:DNA replicative helicase MCM subunit Mcm2 (Cdc46/Mcm family)